MKRFQAFLLALGLVGGGVSSVLAGEYTLIQAPVTAADWTDPAFYSGGKAPTGCLDDVVLTDTAKHLAIAIDGNSSEFAGITNFLNSIQSFKYQGATVTITVPVGQVLTLKRPFYDSQDDERNLGKVYKYGAGELVVDAPLTSGTSSYDHQGDWRVMEGTFRILPSAPEGAYWWVMDYNYVAAGAKIVVPATGNSGAWQIRSVEGAGLITNESAIAARIYKNKSWRNPLPAFSGVIAANIAVHVRSCAMDFTGVANRGTIITSAVNDSSDLGTAYVRKLGNAADAESSMGPGTATMPRRFVYTGLGETSSRSIAVHYLDTFISGGTNGNLRLTGTIENHWSTERRNNGLTLAGDNLYPCWFTGPINGWYTDNNSKWWDIYLEKAGSGQWNLTNNCSTLAGTVAITDGVLGYELLGRRGEVGSLGLATNCHERAAQYDGANAVDYAIRLGDATNALATGLLENLSTQAMMAADRPFALAGCGGFRQNAGEGAVKYAGVKGLGTGAKTLVLDGTSTLTNQVYDVVDGEGTVSVVKRGAGTWLLGGDLTFSGALTVAGGTLIVRRAREDQYGYYRLSLCEIADNNTDYFETSKAWGAAESVQLGLWAADTTRQNMNLALVRQGELRPGTVAMAWNRTIAGDDGGFSHGFSLIELLFAGSRAPYVKGEGETAYTRLWGLFNRGFIPPGRTSAVRGPQRDVPDSWYNFDMCLAEGAKPVTLFDVACCGSGSAPYYGRAFVTAVQLWGSVDGVHWEDLSGIVEGTKPTGTYRWISTGLNCYDTGAGLTVEGNYDAATDWHKDPTLPVYNRSSANGGFAATNTVPMRKFSVLASVGTVTVTGGSTLAFVGANAPALSQVAVDPASGGTIDGFALAANGTLNVAVDDFDGDSLALPLTFTNMDTSALANWSLQMNGATKIRTPRLSCRNGTLMLYKAGLAIYFK